MALAVICLFSGAGLFPRVLHAAGLAPDATWFPSVVGAPSGWGIIVVYAWKEIPFVAFMTITIMMNISMNPINPPGALAPCGRFLYQCATHNTITSSNTLLNNKANVTFVMEISQGRTCSPAASYSTSLPSYLLPAGAMESPSYVPPFSSRREERNVCRPEVLL